MDNKVVVVTSIEGFSESQKNDFEYTSAMSNRHLKVITEVLGNYDGKLYKNDLTGEKIIVFDEVNEAINFAVFIQKKFIEPPKLEVRLGIDRGEVSIEKGEVNGKAYKLASKIASSAKPGSVIVSYDVEEQIKDSATYYSEFIDIYDWGNENLEIRLYAIKDEDLVVPEPQEIKAHIKAVSTDKFSRSSKLLRVLISIGTLIIASAIFAYLNVLSLEPVIDDYSIAVLPFNNLGDQADSELISEAISKDILHNLSLLEDLYVISSYTSMQFKTIKKDKSAIAEQLGVAFLLTGSSHKFDDNIRVSAELTDATTDKVIWKKSFNRDYKKVLQIESEISKEVIDALKLRLSFDDMQNIVGIPTDNIEAYEAFIQARHESDKHTASANKKSIGLYANAIRLDSSYAEAYANIAWSTLQRVNYENIDPSTVQNLTEVYLERAESLNDQIAKIYMVRGALYNLTNDPEKAFAALNKATELAPNDASILLELAKYYQIINQPENQLQQNRLAYQLDPLNFKTALEYVEALIINKDYDEAEDMLNKVSELRSPIDSLDLNKTTIKLYLATENYDKAIVPLKKIAAENDKYLGDLGFSYIKTSDTVLASNIIDSLKSKPNSDLKFYNISKIYAAEGNKDSLYKYLERIKDKSLITRDSLYRYFAPYKNESRFKSILRRDTTR